MNIKMYIRHDQLVRYRKGELAYASTFRDSNSCFEIYIEANKVDLFIKQSGIPTNNYLIRL